MELRVMFDGGSLGNPGKGYGSYRLERVGKAGVYRESVEFEMESLTNNEAEYLTLIQALHRLRQRVAEQARLRSTVTLIGDSKLVLNQVSGEWSCNKPELGMLRSAVLSLLSDFERFSVHWVRREEIVKEFGH